MKSIFISLFFAVIVSFHVAATSYINANDAATGVYIQVQDLLLNGGLPVKAGTPAIADGFLGVGPGKITIEMFMALNGTSLATLEASPPIWTGTNSFSVLAPAQGTFSAGDPFNVPASLDSDGSHKIEVIFYASGGSYTGWSAEATGITPSTNPVPPPSIFGTSSGLISSFILTPVPDEPWTILLAGLGIGALFIYRLRKSAL